MTRMCWYYRRVSGIGACPVQDEGSALARCLRSGFCVLRSPALYQSGELQATANAICPSQDPLGSACRRYCDGPRRTRLVADVVTGKLDVSNSSIAI